MDMGEQKEDATQETSSKCDTEKKKNFSLSILSWFFKKGSLFHGLFESPYNWTV